VVEHSLGKGEVESSIPSGSTIYCVSINSGAEPGPMASLSRHAPVAVLDPFTKINHDRREHRPMLDAIRPRNGYVFIEQIHRAFYAPLIPDLFHP